MIRFASPVQPCALAPDFERLIGGELITEAMPGLLADVGHGRNEMHGVLL